MFSTVKAMLITAAKASQNAGIHINVCKEQGGLHGGTTLGVEQKGLCQELPRTFLCAAYVTGILEY